MARIDANTGNSGKYATNKDKEESIRKPVKRRCREGKRAGQTRRCGPAVALLCKLRPFQGL